jgi:hypothetical protein
MVVESVFVAGTAECPKRRAVAPQILPIARRAMRRARGARAPHAARAEGKGRGTEIRGRVKAPCEGKRVKAKRGMAEAIRSIGRALRASTADPRPFPSSLSARAAAQAQRRNCQQPRSG